MQAQTISCRPLVKLIVAGFMLIGWIFVAASEAAAQEAGKPEGSYSLGTASTGGTYHPIGVALSTLIKLKLLPVSNVDLTAVNTDGSTNNVELLRQGDLQFAIISALAGYDNRTGTGEFEGAGADENLRAITTLWHSTNHFLLRRELQENGTIEDFLKLQGRPVSFGRADSGTVSANQRLMSALGVDAAEAFEVVELGYGESAEALADGSVDGMSVSGGVPIGAVQDVFDALGDDVVMLDIDEEQLALIDRGRGLWQRVVIPKGTYDGLDQDVLTAGMPNILAVRADVDDDVVYQITKTIFEELEYLHGLHGATRQISLDNAVNNLPLPIHDGAARYFQKKGVELPPPPVELTDDLLPRYDTVDDARADVNSGTVSLFTGTYGDTSTRIAAELGAVLENSGDDLRLLTTNGGGIGRNLTDLLYLRGVDAAMVRADILNYANDQNVYPAVRKQVNYISELFPEEVHLLVRNDINSLNDLVGKQVNIGVAGSGSDITSSILLAQLNLAVQPTGFSPQTAIDKLEQGEIAGAFFVGGKPMPFLQGVDGSSGLRLLSLPPVDYFDSYRLADIQSEDYPNLMSEGEVVPTVAVRTALLTYDWRPDSARYGALSNLAESVFANLLTLHEDGYHPKWREVDPTGELAGWERFPPALAWVDNNRDAAQRIADRGQLLLQQMAARRDASADRNQGSQTETSLEQAPTPADEPPADVRSSERAVVEAPADAATAAAPSEAPLTEPTPPAGGPADDGPQQATPPRQEPSATPRIGASAPTF